MYLVLKSFLICERYRRPESDRPRKSIQINFNPDYSYSFKKTASDVAHHANIYLNLYITTRTARKIIR